MKLKLFIVLATVAGIAIAAGNSATLNWTLANTYIDGTPIPSGAVKETLIQWRRPGSTTVAGAVRVAAPAATVVVPNLVCGQFEFTATTIMTVTADNSAESVPPAPYDTQVRCRANPPGALVVQ